MCAICLSLYWRNARIERNVGECHFAGSTEAAENLLRLSHFDLVLSTGKLCCRFATGISLHERSTARDLQGRCGWLGILTFLVIGAVSSRLVYGVARLAGLDLNFHRTVELAVGAAVV